jgi:hypothetical protein
MLNGMPKKLLGRRCLAQSGCSESHACHVLNLKWTDASPMIINGQYYCTLLEGKVRLAVCCKRPKLLEHGVIFLQDSATFHRHWDVQNLVQRRGLEVLAHPPYFPYLAPCDYWLFAYVE